MLLFRVVCMFFFFFFQAEDGIRDIGVTGVQTCALPISVRAISPAVMQALCRYAWPGNVRELENVIERAVIVAKGDTIADVERFLTGEAERPRVDLGLPFRDAKGRVIEEFERAYIVGVLEAEGGKLTAAAKHADMDPKNFYEKLTRYGLRRPAGGLGD